MRAAPFLGMLLLATACSGGTKPAAGNAADAMDNVTAAAKADAAAALIQGGWPTLFADPGRALDALAGTGFRPGDYARTGGRYESTGVRTTLSDGETPEQNLFYTVLTGSKQAVDALRFEIELADPARADNAKRTLVNALRIAFAKIGVPGADAVRQPILDEKDAEGTLPGARWTVVRKPMKGKDARRITVTFNPAAPDAAESQPRKQ